ncbi:FkbM family methyltransferase [Rubripirellula reticaptiva]|uniref:2-O-methyltransferase NoeI n=1 Tax=Rubripirellula reticaptiva TaxID=2528013 RepID=A0A5C6FFA0_9BACT|nr:FkbM family methyltransferase [Rubripirellula reticaptiva]TWU58309.1 2-O-methyltransferase NoeI [Rubripirellula reticaptiva]
MIIDLRRELRRYGIKPDHVLHVGAHEGQEDGIYRKMKATPVYVEANPEVFSRLRENLPDRECHMVAISDHEGTAEFHVTSADQSSSLLSLAKHSEIYPDIVETKTFQVQCTTIDKLLEGRAESFDVLSLDIQGAELLALKGASELLQTVSAIMTEVNREEMYHGCVQIEELDNYLDQFGFTRVKVTFPYHESWGDALYLKNAIASRSGITKLMRRFFPVSRAA